ncbi:MAG TPA: hypothetical protein VM734_17000, partial [Kofleriaceae bacterium]|nr:hypothetical protein [Kofleriaceae bacterium]
TEQASSPAEVTAGQAAQIAAVVADGKEVAAGDPLLRFVGNPALEQRLKGLDYDITSGVPREIERQTKLKEKAEESKNAAAAKAAADKIAERTKRLGEKRQEREEILKKLEGAVVKAPVAGKVTVKVKKGTRTTADQIVATVLPPPTLVATFEVAADKSFTADASVRVAVKATPATKANCTVAKVDGVKVSVECPSDAGITAGVEVVLE